MLQRSGTHIHGRLIRRSRNRRKFPSALKSRFLSLGLHLHRALSGLQLEVLGALSGVHLSLNDPSGKSLLAITLDFADISYVQSGFGLGFIDISRRTCQTELFGLL